MIKYNVVVPFEEGLHARPASELVNVLKNVASEVKMSKDGMDVNPKSILGILTLGASLNDEITVEIDGEDEAEVKASLDAFFTQKH